MSLLLAVLSGLLLGGSLPPYHGGALEWIALVPLFLAVRRSGPLKGMGVAAVAMLAVAFVLVYPLRTPEEWGNAGGAAIIFGFVLIWTCAFAAATKTPSPARWAGTVAAAGVIGEWIVQPVFPVYLALGQWRNPAVMPVASWVGAWGISFLVYASNAAVACAVDALWSQRMPPRHASPDARSAVRFALISLGVLGALHLWGAWATSREAPGQPLRAAAIQPGDDDALPLLAEAARRGAVVAVWPEGALSEPLGPDLRRYRVPGLYQVIGFTGAPPAEGLPDNLAALARPDGTLLGRYSKIHLFGTEVRVHRAGRRPGIIPSPWGTAGLAICYDTVFEDTVRALARGGARIVFVPNGDPESAHESLAALHAAATVFRAAENGVPIVRSDWRGFSMVIDGRGRIVREIGPRAPDLVVGDLTVPERPGTLYTRIGDLFPPACLILLIGLIAREMIADKGPAAGSGTPRLDSFNPHSSKPTGNAIGSLGIMEEADAEAAVPAGSAGEGRA